MATGRIGEKSTMTKELSRAKRSGIVALAMVACFSAAAVAGDGAAGGVKTTCGLGPTPKVMAMMPLDGGNRLDSVLEDDCTSQIVHFIAGGRDTVGGGQLPFYRDGFASTAVIRKGGGVLVAIERRDSGRVCPYLYHILTITGGKPVLGPAFGKCTKATVSTGNSEFQFSYADTID